jgi:hypothetical protein
MRHPERVFLSCHSERSEESAFALILATAPAASFQFAQIFVIPQRSGGICCCLCLWCGLFYVVILNAVKDLSICFVFSPRSEGSASAFAVALVPNSLLPLFPPLFFASNPPLSLNP